MTTADGMDLGAIRAGLKSIFQDISGIGEAATAKGNRPVDEEGSPWTINDPVTDARLDFRLTSSRSLGLGDENRMSYDPDAVIAGDTSGPAGAPETGGITNLLCGPRILTFSVKVTCQDLDVTAFEYVEKIRSNLGRTDIADRMSAFDCSINDWTDSRDLSYRAEGREVSCAGFDLILNTASNLIDTTFTTIETVEASRQT